MPQSRTLYVGLDGHTDASAVASVAQDHGAEVISLGHIGPRQGDIETRIRRLQSNSPHLIFVSAAGPCGDWLSRSLTTKGRVCWVVAPSLLPTKPGERGQTIRRNASTLARLRRSGDLPPVDVPTGEDAAMRDLCLALSGPGPSASPPAPGEGAHAHPGHAWDKPRDAWANAIGN